MSSTDTRPETIENVTIDNVDGFPVGSCFDFYRHQTVLPDAIHELVLTTPETGIGTNGSIRDQLGRVAIGELGPLIITENPTRVDTVRQTIPDAVVLIQDNYRSALKPKTDSQVGVILEPDATPESVQRLAEVTRTRTTLSAGDLLLFLSSRLSDLDDMEATFDAIARYFPEAVILSNQSTAQSSGEQTQNLQKFVEEVRLTAAKLNSVGRLLNGVRLNPQIETSRLKQILSGVNDVLQ